MAPALQAIPLSHWESPQCRRPAFNPWIRKFPWRREWYSLQYSGLGKPMDRGFWRAAVHGVAKESGTTERLSNNSNSKVGSSSGLVGASEQSRRDSIVKPVIILKTGCELGLNPAKE